MSDSIISTRTLLNGNTFRLVNSMTTERFLNETARMVAEEYPNKEWVIGTYTLGRKCLDCDDPYEGRVDVFPMTRKERKIREPKHYAPTVIYKNGVRVFFTHGSSDFHRLEDKSKEE